jgi:hypothetical protein
MPKLACPAVEGASGRGRQGIAHHAVDRKRLNIVVVAGEFTRVVEAWHSARLDTAIVARSKDKCYRIEARLKE